MSDSLFEEYHNWFPGTKIELVNGQLIIGDRLIHGRRLLQQILRGWEIEAIVALAPEQLWWEALSQVFGCPIINLDAPDVLKNWATQIQFQPDHPLYQGDWQWSYSSLRQNLRLAMFLLGHRYENLGQSLGGGFVNRLGNHGVMPDVLFYRGQPRNQLYEYYLEGAADVIVEIIQPGCEDYLWNVKRSLYQQAGVPELWIIDAANRHIILLQLINGEYQQQTPDESGCYNVSNIPGLTFFPEKLWLADDDLQSPLESKWFEVAADAPRLDRIRRVGEGVDWSRRLVKFPVDLNPVAIAFEDYIFWCPEAKFEFANDRPEIGGRDGIQGLTGMLLMTFGLLDVVKLAHPRDWVAALLQVRSQAHDPVHKAAWWKLAREVATFLRSHYEVTRIAVAGDLVAPEPLNFWSELVLVVWGLPPSGRKSWERSRDGYTNPRSIVQQLSEQPQIQLIDASRELTGAEEQVIFAGMMEL